jgi:hypothetical protein
MSTSKSKKSRTPSCVSINLVLCGEPLRKVLGKIGFYRNQLGDDSTSKKRACYELLASNEYTNYAFSTLQLKPPNFLSVFPAVI